MADLQASVCHEHGNGHVSRADELGSSIDTAVSASTLNSSAEDKGFGTTTVDAPVASTTIDTVRETSPSDPEATSRSLSRTSQTSRRETEEEIRQMYVIPEYLRKAMANAVESKGADYLGSETPSTSAKAPICPVVVMINSKSGGRLGPELRSHLNDLVTREQVYDLSATPPADFVRHGLRCLENFAQNGDRCADETRERIRILVAGGDGTVGWVLGSLAALHTELHGPVPPVGIIPLGTGNDLARSFGWGGSFPYPRRSAVKKYLLKAAGSRIQFLDSWQVVVKTLPELHIKFPHALRPQQHIPVPSQGIVSDESKAGVAASFRGVFYNYFSIGMDAQVAYGFHHLRNKAPYLAQGPISNKMIYSGYSCTQGWFCTPPQKRLLRNFMHIEIKRKQSSDWEPVELPLNVRAVVFLNLQSYASGRNPWGHPSTEYNEKKGFVEPRPDDGLLEIFGLYDGWHTSFVMINLLTAKRLAQASALQLELWGGKRHRAYMQMDGEPWEQPLISSEERTRLEISSVSTPSLMLKAVELP